MDVVALADGREIPQLGFGTYKLVGSACEAAVKMALDAGYRHIDTAQYYDNQPAIGRAIQGIERDQLYLTSKIWPGAFTKARVPAACERILRELGVEYLDLLLIHWPDRSVPIGETLAAMDALKQAGKVRSLGVSNFTERHIRDALGCGVEIVMEQVEAHVYFAQTALKHFCNAERIAVTAYTPLAQGVAAGDPVLEQIGAKHGKTAGQVAIRWLLEAGFVVIPKSGSPDRIRENAEVFDFALDADDTAKIADLDTGHRRICPEIGDFEYV